MEGSRHDRRRELVERLLHDDRYTEEYAGHWSTVWTNILIGRSGGNERGSMISRDGMQKYLRDSLHVTSLMTRLSENLSLLAARRNQEPKISMEQSIFWSTR